jgi:hypothetical protein
MKRLNVQRQFRDALNRKYDRVKNDPNLDPAEKLRQLRNLDVDIQNAEMHLTRMEQELNEIITRLGNPPPQGGPPTPPANP